VDAGNLQCRAGNRYIANDAGDLVAAIFDLGRLVDTMTGRASSFDHSGHSQNHAHAKFAGERNCSPALKRRDLLKYNLNYRDRGLTGYYRRTRRGIIQRSSPTSP